MAQMLNSQENQQKTPIKVISEWYVKPKYEVDAAKQAYNLSPSDIAMLCIDPGQRGLLYTLPNPTTSTDRTKTMANLLEKLNHSLSLALVHFYPLAGRFITQKYPDEHACSIYIDCTKGPGARLIHAIARDLNVSDIISPIDVPTFVQSLFEHGEKLVNYVGHTRALLSIQVTELQDGVFIGFTINHSVVDGTSFMHFVSMLSEIFRSIELDGDDSTTNIVKISRVPVYNYKPWINNYEDVAFLKLPYLEPEEFVEYGYDPGLLRERIFHFSPTTLKTIKDMANQECRTQDITISSFQALIALVWRSITRARNLSSDQSTSCSMVVNTRTRFDPPVSDDYFGNFVAQAQKVCRVDELLGNGLGWAAMNLREAIMAQDAEAILGFYKVLSESPTVFRRNALSEFHGPNNVIVGGSARFDMYGPEFGLGRALTVRTGYGNKGDAKVTIHPGCEGGSVDLEICLRPQFMASLEADLEFMSHVSLC